VAGVIDNMRGVPHEKDSEEVFGTIGIPVIHHILRDRGGPRVKTEEDSCAGLLNPIRQRNSENLQERFWKINLAQKLKTQPNSKEIKKIIGKYS
jgi:hypothetical protein